VTKFVLRRLLQAIPTLLGISILIFAVIRLAPGDPVNLFFDPTIKGEDLERMRRQLGLDRPLYIQYIDWVTNLARGDFGRSFVTREPVLSRILERLPNTIQLSLAAVVIALLVGPTLGILAATHRGGLIDQLVRVLAVVVDAVPNFWLGLMLILLFSVHLRWLPASGYGTPQHIILPAFCLGVFTAPVAMRLVRYGMLDVLSQDYIRTARAKGLTEWAVVVGHALRNTMIPVITVLGLQFGQLMGGAVITETVFAWPGVALLLINAIYRSDIPVMQAAVIILALIIAGVNFLVDVIVALLDPRVRLR